MMVSDGNGVPIGLYLDSAGHHEIRLAEATLKTVRVPQRRGRPRTRPKELVADKAYDSRSFRIWLRRRGIKPTIATIQRKAANAVVAAPSVWERDTAGVGSLNAASGG